MSGIYIKGMGMPKAGAYTCELGVLDENTAVLTINTPINESQRSYRLIPVPEHGRLIESEPLEAIFETFAYKNNGKNYAQYIVAKTWVENSPTIILADKVGGG